MSISPAAGAVTAASTSHAMSMLTPEQILSRNPHSALRLPGATYGSLSKSHNSLTVPPNLSWVHAHLVSAANPNRDEGAADSLAEAVGGNERSKAYEYTVLVGNVLRSYDSFAAFWRGDHPTSEVRIVGASAWNPPPSAKKGALRSASVTKSGGVGSGMTSWFGAARSPSASSVQVASPPPPVAGATLAPTLASPPMMSATMKIATGGLASSSEDNAPLGTAITSTLASEAAATSGYASPTAASSAASADDNNNTNNNTMSDSWQSVPSPSAVATPTASASAPPQTSTFRIVTYAGTHIYCSAPTPADRDVWLASLHAGLESSMMSVAEVLNEVVEQAEVAAENDIDTDTAAKPNTQTKKIREPNLSVTEQTILTPPLVQKRGIGSALRRKLLEAQQKGQPAPDQSELISKQSDANISSFGYAAPFESLSPPANKHCISCGRYPPQTAFRPQSCPLSQYGMETRVDVCAECLISQGLLGHVKSYTGMYSADALERSALVKGRELVQNCIQATLAREETDRKERERQLERELREKSERELEELVKEAGAICVHDCDAEDIAAKIDAAEQNETEDEDVLAARKAMAEAEAVFDGSDDDDSGDARDEGDNGDNGDNDGNDGNANDNENEEGDSNSSNETGDGTAGSSSWTAVNSHATSESTDKSNALSGSWSDVPKEDSSASAGAGTRSVDESVLLQGHTGRTLDSWVSLPPLPSTTVALLELVGSPSFQTLRRRSRVLDQNCKRLESGVYGGTDTAAEFLETLEEHAREASVCASGVSGVSASAIELKKQALALSADLGSAIRLLKESAMGQKGPASTETLASILEYLLDVVEEGDLASVGFFWPQIRQIHLNMLPAVDVGSLVRIELVEDFLLTVAVKHSVHLALELVWGCIADLEESLGAPSESSPDCRRRRFAVLRFVCELESLIFDFDEGWGGGSVSLRSMLSPSQHQSDMVKDAFLLLQLHRRYGSHHLSRSVRLSKLKADSEDEEDGEDGAEIVPDEDKDEDAGLERLRMVQHADYWTTQILFCRKLGDTAERMRFTPKEERRAKLETELRTLNASGKLGGDPLNRLAAEGDLIHVVNVPATEGHVFNSKARTPILMLMELIREESDISRAAIRRSRTPSKKEEALDEGIVGVQMMDNRDALEIDTGACEDDADDARSVDEADIYKSAIDEGADVPPSPLSTPKKPMVLGASVLGSAEGTRSRLNTEDSAHGSDSSVASEKETMGSLVESMLGTKHFELPDLGDSSANTDGEDAAERSGDEDAIGKVEETEPKTTSDDANDGEDAEQEDSLEPTKPETLPSPSNTPQEPSSLSSPSSPPSSRPIPRSRSGSNIISARKGGLMESDNDDIGAFSQHGEGRRAVLEAIFLKGSKSSNPVAAAVAPGAQRAYQAMDRQRAFALINQTTKAADDAVSAIDDDVPTTTEATNESPAIVEAAVAHATEDEDLIAALRLLLLQNRASTTLSGASFLAASDDSISGGPEKPPGEPVDAGEIDSRLAGCGILAPTVANALKMWKEGVITNEELISLVQKDNQFLEHSADPDNESKLMEDSNFWGRFAFGERWAEKKARIQTTSQHGSVTGWDLSGVIIKSNDDLRQEAFVMQLIELCREAFESAGLELWVHPYRILATGRTTGIIEMVRNAMSFDALKKRPGYDSGGLRGHLERMSEFTADAAAAFETAQKNFICSLASYSLMSYLFQFKDRHNGNLLLDTGGHVIHIDFGFVFGIAPGGSFSLEQSTPFKLTEEMLEVMGGTKSSLFSEFVTLFCCGFLALQAHAETFITLIEITAEGSSFPCFEGRAPDKVVAEMRERFCIGLDRETTVTHALEIIRLAVTSYGTKQYDAYQYYSQGIAN